MFVPTHIHVLFICVGSGSQWLLSLEDKRCKHRQSDFKSPRHTVITHKY